MKHINLLPLAIAVILAACNVSGEKNTKMPALSGNAKTGNISGNAGTNTLFPDSILPPQTTLGGNQQGNVNPAHGQPGHICGLAVGAPLNSSGSGPNNNEGFNFKTGTPQATLNPNATTGKLNPKHGEPGHRCDIGVGQPLNSNANTTTSNISSPTITQTPVNTTPNTKSAPADGLNPKHGEPGHRCDIAVGQPLNSKSTTATTPAKNPTDVLLPQPSTVKNEEPVIPLAAGTKLNPKHGEPGHDCSIAVGQPLKQ